MSQVPNFAKVDFADTDTPVGTGSSVPLSVPWLTPEGIAVKPVYGEQDLAGLDFLDTYPGKPPFLRGPYPAMYAAQPWTCLLYTSDAADD
mgnify:CR=1 FL=1